MKEKDLVNILMSTNLVELCFKNENIINITNEYSLYMDNVYKSLDIFVNCENSVILIECKQQLKAHDIGQLLTYNLMYDTKHGKDVKLAMAYIECRKDELNIIRSYIDKYNLGISLIHLYGEKDNYKYDCFHHKTKSTIDVLDELDKKEIYEYIKIKDWFKYYYNSYEKKLEKIAKYLLIHSPMPMSLLLILTNFCSMDSFINSYYFVLYALISIVIGILSLLYIGFIIIKDLFYSIKKEVI